MSIAILSTLRSHAAGRHVRRFRSIVSACALIAVAWPSLGPLPWLVHDFGAHVRHQNGHVHVAMGDHDASDASSIPGSPTHPIDHGCPECQVLKHLSRCVLPVLTIAFCAPVVSGIVARHISVARPPARVPAHLPPVRAPPSAIA